MNKFLIVGLGNVGKEYEDTRHNVGFNCLDFALGRFKLSWDFNKTSDSSFAEYKYTPAGSSEVHTAIFLRPKSYMNVIGKNVKKAH